MTGKKEAQKAQKPKKTGRKKDDDRGTEGGKQVSVNPPPDGGPERGGGKEGPKR